MTREELFQAIGEVEGSRLMRTELSRQEPSREAKEEPVMKKKRIHMGRIVRNLIAAVILTSMLAVTAYAVGAYVIFESPQEMLTAVFGDKTGYDHGDYMEVPDPERPGSLLNVMPEYDRVEADPTVVQEDVAPYVSPVGQSISFHGMTLTVDSFLYDSVTQCGVVTYTLENGPEYYLQYDGAVDYMGRSHPVDFNQYGYHYIIEEKTTDTMLAASFYFRYDPASGDGEFAVDIDDGYTHDEITAVYKDCMEEVKAQYTREEAIEKAKEVLGEDYQTYLEIYEGGYSEDYEATAAYDVLRDMAVMEYWEIHSEAECPDKIVFDCSESRELSHRTTQDGGITISPMSIVIDVAPLEFLHRENWPLNGDLVDSVVIHYTDGSEYVVCGDNVSNTLFALNTTVDGTMNTDYSILTMMFNRIIDLDKVESVSINGTELKLES